MSDKELIKQEIERRFNDNMEASEQYTENSKSRVLFTSAAKEDYDLLAFIDSLSEESASEDLEEEIKSWIPAHIEGGGEYMRKVAIEWSEIVARHFAEWGRNHFEDKSEMVSEDLKEEIENYIKDSLAIKFPTTDKEQIKADIRYIARHFAEWQKQKDLEDSIKSDMTMPNKFYEKGRFDIMEEMMKYAVEAEVFVDYNINFGYGSLTANIDLDEQHLKEGDKVKIIIVKEN